MFGRDKTKATDQPVVLAKPGGKGRATPTRKEAEAAARERAKVPRTRKELAAAQRAGRSGSSQSIRAAMKAGDERYYLPRDKGPVRRFVRDTVDSRFSIIELLIPILLANIVLGLTRNATLVSIGNTLLLTGLVVMVLDLVLLRRRLKKQLAERFPGESQKGLVYYATTRSLQMKFMRLPKSKVKIGQQLPERYR